MIVNDPWLQPWQFWLIFFSTIVLVWLHATNPNRKR